MTENTEKINSEKAMRGDAILLAMLFTWLAGSNIYMLATKQVPRTVHKCHVIQPSAEIKYVPGIMTRHGGFLNHEHLGLRGIVDGKEEYFFAAAGTWCGTRGKKTDGMKNLEYAKALVDGSEDVEIEYHEHLIRNEILVVRTKAGAIDLSKLCKDSYETKWDWE